MSLKSTALFYKMGVKENTTNISTILGRALTIAMLLIVWTTISGMIPDEILDQYGVTHVQLQYYFAITEVMAFSLSYSFVDLQTDIRQGYFETALLKPKSFFTQKMSLWLGQGFGIAIILLPFSLGLTYFLANQTPPTLEQVGQSIVLILPAMFILACIHYIAGTACLWIKHSEPAYWMMQKFNFVCGGLMLPITLYPEWIQDICWMTPFPAILFTPASTMLGDNQAMSFEEAFIYQIFWASILGATAIMLHKSAIYKITKIGGDA